MAELSQRDRTIKVKIVYYGPPVCGKTTNLQVLHHHAASERRGEMISINSAQDRTILFDLLPLRTGGLRGFDLRLQVLAVPGQAMYATTRRLVLKGTDSLVFVANSAADRWDENLQSFREMTQNLVSHRLDPSVMPIVFQYNKRDLPDVMDLEVMDRALNGRRLERIPAVAVRGEGVIETFKAILLRTVEEVCRRYAILDARGGQPAEQWTQQAVRGLFGTQALTNAAVPTVEPPPLPVASRPAPILAEPPPTPTEPRRIVAQPAPAVPDPVLSPPPDTPPPPRPEAFELPTKPLPIVTTALPASAPPFPPAESTHRRVRVAVQSEDPGRAPSAGSDIRVAETLVESYAEASEQLSSALNDLREERDLARRRLEDLQKTLLVAQDILAGKPLQLALDTVLTRMADVVGVEEASFLIPQTARPPLVAVLRGLAEEPLLRVPAAWRRVAEAATNAAAPRLHLVTEAPELVQALERGIEPFAAVLAIPFRTPRGLQALAHLYFTGDAALPSQEKMTHLGEVSRALSAALDLASTMEAALAATAALRGLEDVVGRLGAVRDGLGEMRRRGEGATPGFGPALEAAFSAGRSVLAFGKGEVHRESVDVEELMGSLGTEYVSAQISPGVETVSVDRALLKVALRSLAEHVRRPGGDLTRVEVKSQAGEVRFTFAAARPVGAGLGLTLARRIAELHGGSLSIQAGVGGQDLLTLALPR